MPTLHLVLLAVWLGLILAETFLEFVLTNEKELPSAAKLHYYIDIFLEIPVVTGVLVTGFLLLRSHGPLTGLLGIKIIFGLIAIAVNYYCAAMVILRYLGKQDTVSLQHRGSQIRWAWVGIPFGLGAFYMGWRLFL